MCASLQCIELNAVDQEWLKWDVFRNPSRIENFQCTLEKFLTYPFGAKRWKLDLIRIKSLI